MVPFVFVLVFGLIDFARVIQANTTLAEAARQGARQAVTNAPAQDNPFGAGNGQPCSGTVFTQNAAGTGCLTDTRIAETVTAVLAGVTRTIVLFANTTAAACPTPPIGQANVCVSPAQSGTAATYPDCAHARAALARDPAPGELGARYAEWFNPRYRGCFLVQVTVVYAYRPWTQVIGSIVGSSLRLSASTSMVAEY